MCEGRLKEKNLIFRDKRMKKNINWLFGCNKAEIWLLTFSQGHYGI